MADLPAPLHSHYSDTTHRFYEHEHVHAGAHFHEAVQTGHGPRVITRNQPGNYSPHGLPENRDTDG